MKIQSTTLLLSICLAACQNSSDDLEEFRSTKLNLTLERSESNLSLASGDAESDLSVTHITILCDNEKSYPYDLDENSQTEVFLNLSGCNLRADELVKKFDPPLETDSGDVITKIIYSRHEESLDTNDSLFYFFPENISEEVNDELDGSLKALLVRAVTEFTLTPVNDCSFHNCNYYNASATIVHSDLVEIEAHRKNPDDYAKITVDTELDPVANCDFNVDESIHDTDNHKRLTVVDCDEGDLSFALKNVNRFNFNTMKKEMSIEKAKNIQASYPITFVKVDLDDGRYRYTITEDYSKIMNDLEVDSLGPIFSDDSNSILVIDIDPSSDTSAQGLSSLVFYLKNACKIDTY